MAEAWARQLTRWIDARLIDEDTSARVRAGEAENMDSSDVQPLSSDPRIVDWTVAVGLPLIVAIGLRHATNWPNLLATFWALALFTLRPIAQQRLILTSPVAGGLLPCTASPDQRICQC